jgi:homoserine dehydrogenase
VSGDEMGRIHKIDIALLGCGRLGQGIYKLWQQRRKKIIDETGIDINIKYILIKHPDFKRNAEIPNKMLIHNLTPLLEDPAIKIVIDAIGGIEPTYSIIRKFLEKGCHLVSANRSLLATKMKNLYEIAREKNLYIRFDSALIGSIPLTRTLRKEFVSCDIKSIWGIISSHANYILTEMRQRNKPLKDILKLKEIQHLSESYLLADFEGSDAAQKLALIAALCFGVEVNYLHVYAGGVKNVTLLDLDCADQFGYEIKHLAIMKNLPGGLELRVHPTMVPKTHPLTLVSNDYNAIQINTDILGEYLLYGKGSGINPAACAVLRDTLDIVSHMSLAKVPKNEYLEWNKKSLISIEQIYSKFYLRIRCKNVPGVIGKIATILGDHSINIDSAHASLSDRNKDPHSGFVQIFTGMANERNILQSIAEIKKIKVVMGESSYYHILDEESYGISTITS